MSELNTRIQLKRDTAANWNALSDEFVLLSGELGFETDTQQVKIGIGKTWGQTPYIKINDIRNVEGLEAALAGVQTAAIAATENTISVYTDKVLEDIAAGKNTGDIAIIKNTIAGGKFEYTAYVWNADLTSDISGWQAMDGNYSAENVFFKENITLAGDYTEVGNIKLSEGELPAAGKSVKTLMENIFTKELYPSKTLPSYTFASTSSQGVKEVGDTYTVPGATFTYKTTGSYTYDPKDAACGISANSVTIARTTPGEESTKTNTTEIAKDGTLVLGTGSTNVTFLDYESRKTYNFTCAATHTEGVMPKTNLGNDYPTARITAADGWSSGPTTASATYYGYRNFWIGAVADGNTTIDETFVKENLTAVKSAAKNFQVTSAGSSSTAGYERVELVAGAKRIILVLPATGNYKRTLSQVLLKSASNTPITDSYVNIGQIDVSGKVTGQNKMKYNVFVYQPAAIGAGEVHDIQVK